MNLLQEFTLQNENTRKILTFSQMNFVFGYSGSGKTTFLETLNAAFSGKDKTWICNGGKILPNDFNVIFISGNDDINSHLKLSSKSLLQKLIARNQYSPTFKESLKSISQNLENVRQEVERELSSVLDGTRASIKNQDDPLDFVIDNLTITCAGTSSSGERRSLFQIANALTKITNSKTIVLIDDFCKDFDEETTLAMIDEARSQNAYFILGSNKPFSQIILDDDCAIIAMRDGEPVPLPSIKNLVMDAIDGQSEYQSFEAYMLGKGYSELSGIAESYAKLMREDRLCSLLRILTSKNPKISTSLSHESVTIVPRTAQEEAIYRKVFDMLDIK